MADTLDILSLAEAKAELGIEDGHIAWDAQLAGFITGVSRAIDAACGPVVNRTVTAELHDGGVTKIELKKRPVASVSSVTEYDGTTAQALTAETNSAKTANDYLIDGAYIRRRAAGTDYRFASGRRNVSVTYVAGRAATTAAVDQQFKAAARAWVRHLWTVQKGLGSQTFESSDSNLFGISTFDGVPFAVKTILMDQLVPSGLQ